MEKVIENMEHSLKHYEGELKYLQAKQMDRMSRLSKDEKKIKEIKKMIKDYGIAIKKLNR